MALLGLNQGIRKARSGDLIGARIAVLRGSSAGPFAGSAAGFNQMANRARIGIGRTRGFAGARARLGDPGFFGNLVGKLDKVVTAGVGFLPGGNVAKIGADALVNLKHKLSQHRGAIGLAAGTAAGALGAMAAGKLMGGGAATAVHAGTGRRRYRRMNPLNYHALKRSSRRIHMAAKIMRTVFHQAKHVRAPKRAPRGVRPQRRHRGRFTAAAA